MANEVTMTSLEVVELINNFRLEEGGRKELRHCDFMTSVKKEIDTLKSLGLQGVRNISLTTYTDKQDKERPCYKMNKSGIIQSANINGEGNFSLAKYTDKHRERNTRYRRWIW